MASPLTIGLTLTTRLISIFLDIINVRPIVNGEAIYKDDDFLSLFKKALEHPSRNLKLSAEWMMADFEHDIRASWSAFFLAVTPKGCHFHYAKVAHAF